MLGLGNAATPLGLRAMRLLDSLNPFPGTATNAMCTFLALNTASIQLLPLTAIGILATQGAKSPTAIVITAFLATACAAIAGVLAAKILERFPFFKPTKILDSTPSSPSPQPAPPDSLDLELLSFPPLSPFKISLILAYLAAFLLMFLLLVFPEWFQQFNPPPLPPDFAGKSLPIRALMSLSLLAIPFLLSFFPLYATLRGVKIYEQFVEGAKEAWHTAQRTIPYLVAMLVAIGMLQKAGVIGLLSSSLSPILSALGFPADLLPMVLMRPLSGSATNGLFVEVVQRLHDPDG
ncbi:MAG: nucleoside recognition protein, partial [Verrucomicrobia bacterium]|nr:nucleoside recognition protein [Verrucomicrobiota bacterium]